MTGKGLAEIYKELDHLTYELSLRTGNCRPAENGSAPLFEMDNEGHLKKVPEVLSRITGFSIEELCLIKLENLVLSEDREKLTAAIVSVLEGAPIVVTELELFSEDVGAHPVELTMLPIRHVQELDGFWGIIRDIKSRKALEESLFRTKEEQNRSQRFLSDFVSLLVREIRQPLTEILLTLELIHSGQFGEVTELQKARVDQIITAVERSKAILNEAIGSSRDVGKEIELTRDIIDLKDLVENGVKDRSSLLKAMDISCELDLPEGPVMVAVDRKAFAQAFGNILDRTMDQLPNGGDLRIYMELRKDALLLTLSNSGPGLGDEEVAQLFERFHITTDTEGGPFQKGLSLYMAKRLIESHDGRVWCESFPGLGTSFLLTLPIKTGEGGA